MGRPFTNAVRDEQMWRLFAEGFTSRQISERFGISRQACTQALARYRARRGAPARRPESARSMVLRLSTLDPPLSAPDISAATGLSESLVLAVLARIEAAA